VSPSKIHCTPLKKYTRPSLLSIPSIWACVVKFLVAFNHSRIVKRTLYRFISRLTHKATLTQHRTVEKSFIKPRVIALPAPKNQSNSVLLTRYMHVR